MPSLSAAHLGLVILDHWSVAFGTEMASWKTAGMSDNRSGCEAADTGNLD